MTDKPKVYLFTDGSCGAGEDIGAWTALLATSQDRQLLYGVVNPTTISRMELIPIIEGLIWLRNNWAMFLKDVHVGIYSDSEYVIKTMSGMYEPHKNMDLWTAFGLVSKDFKLSFTWYERNKLAYMEACDSTCSTMRLALKDTANKLFGNYKKSADSLLYAELP